MKRARRKHRAPSSINYLQPEQSAQQSAEGQHPVFAFAVPATPSATTAINTSTFNTFIVFSFRSGKSCSEAELNPHIGPRTDSFSKCGEVVSEGEYPALQPKRWWLSQRASRVARQEAKSATGLRRSERDRRPTTTRRVSRSG